MKKNPKTLEDRAAYVKNEVNNRHKSLNVSDAIRLIAAKLFMSEDAIWKDFAKTPKNEENN